MTSLFFSFVIKHIFPVLESNTFYRFVFNIYNAYIELLPTQIIFCFYKPFRMKWHRCITYLVSFGSRNYNNLKCQKMLFIELEIKSSVQVYRPYFSR